MSISDSMTKLADSIRAKSGKTEKLSIEGMITAVNSISTGSVIIGGGGEVPPSIPVAVDNRACDHSTEMKVNIFTPPDINFENIQRPTSVTSNLTINTKCKIYTPPSIDIIVFNRENKEA